MLLVFAAFDGTVLDATTDDDCVAGRGSTIDDTIGATVHFVIAAADIDDEQTPMSP